MIAYQIEAPTFNYRPNPGETFKIYALRYEAIDVGTLWLISTLVYEKESYQVVQRLLYFIKKDVYCKSLNHSGELALRGVFYECHVGKKLRW